MGGNADAIQMLAKLQSRQMAMYDASEERHAVQSRQTEERNAVQIKQSNEVLAQAFHAVSKINNKLDGVQQEVKGVKGDVGEVRDDLVAFRKQVKSDEFKADMKGRIFPLLDLMVDTEKGWVCWQPRGFTASNGVYSEHVVINVPMIAHFCFKEFPDAIDKDEVEILFRNSSIFPRSPAFPYPDFIDLLVQCGYRHLAIGPQGNSMEAEMRKRFIIMPADIFKDKLVNIREVYGDEMRDRDPLWNKTSYEVFGNTYAYASPSEREYITAIRRPMYLAEASKTPAMLYPWVKETFTPMMKGFFGMPLGDAGDHHVVNGRFKPSSTLVVSHDDACKAIAQKKSGLRGARREARLAKRHGEGAGPQKKKPKKRGGSRRG